jgi:hypothetical protein
MRDRHVRCYGTGTFDFICKIKTLPLTANQDTVKSCRLHTGGSGTDITVIASVGDPDSEIMTGSNPIKKS